MAPELLLLLCLAPPRAGAAPFAPPLDEYEAAVDSEAGRAWKALKAFEAGAGSYADAADLEEAGRRRAAQSAALIGLKDSVDAKVSTYRRSLEGLEVNFAAETLNGRRDPEAIVKEFTAQRRTVDRFEAHWRALNDRILSAAQEDARALRREMTRRDEERGRRRRRAAAAGALLAAAAVLLIARRRRAPPPPAPPPPDRRHRPKGPARLE
ncbi:MAG: hypothetical protein HY928_01330 [Elusimicrobia bacterium]|nr:hypothetical protein [Elusimicrobiota bacterium]